MHKACFIVLVAAAMAATGGCSSDRAKTRPAGGETSAIEFLKREVPAWSRDNGCFSCHNNGDAARALFAAKRAGLRVGTAALRDTMSWITQPDRWEHNQGDPGFSDQRLANIQFAASLVSAQWVEVEAQAALRQAARKVAADQDADGAWQVERQNPIGSPATYGSTLATWMALQILRAAGTPEVRGPAQKAEAWLRRVSVENIPNAATLLQMLAHDTDAGASEQRRECLALIRKAQTTEGGWGPYEDAPAEVFDTSLVLIALAEVRNEEGAPGMIQRGRAFLLKEQRADGSWAATTRPSGGQSYAQQMSTTGWATLALLRTRGQ